MRNTPECIINLIMFLIVHPQYCYGQSIDYTINHPSIHPGLISITVMLALLRFSLIKFKEWSTAQRASFSKFLNLPTSLLFLDDLHWLQISSQIQYKLAVIYFHTVSGTAPPYLSELLHLCSPSLSLCSAVDTRIFGIPRMGRRTLGKISFQYIGPVLWNSLPISIRRSSSLSYFKSKLKTHLFSSAYWSVVLTIHHQ